MSEIGPGSIHEFAEALGNAASDFAHDANNLALQLSAACMLVGEHTSAPPIEPAILDEITEQARTITNMARALRQLVADGRGLESGS